eukprot:2927367-Alexandrium_andersonii.AAC.1
MGGGAGSGRWVRWRRAWPEEPGRLGWALVIAFFWGGVWGAQRDLQCAETNPATKPATKPRGNLVENFNEIQNDSFMVLSTEVCHEVL